MDAADRSLSLVETTGQLVSLVDRLEENLRRAHDELAYTRANAVAMVDLQREACAQVLDREAERLELEARCNVPPTLPPAGPAYAQSLALRQLATTVRSTKVVAL